MDFPFGINREADIYYISAMDSSRKNSRLIDRQVPQFVEAFEEEDLASASYNEAVDYIRQVTILLVEKHKNTFPSQGWDIHDEDSISWFLIMLSMAYNQITNGRVSIERMFKDVFIQHFSAL